MQFALLAVVLLLAPAFPAFADVADTRTERALLLPGANFKLVIPREDWVITREQPRADGRSVYYALSSAKRELTAWIFIDQTPVCQSATACLEFALKNTAYADAKNISFDTQDPFKVVQFMPWNRLPERRTPTWNVMRRSSPVAKSARSSPHPRVPVNSSSPPDSANSAG